MGLFRRRNADPEAAAVLDGFLPVGEAIEAAQRGLLRAIPTFRDDGAPLEVALAAFEEHLAEADRALVRWSAPAADVERCRAAVEAARAEAAKLASEPNGLVFEALNARVGDVLFELEAVADLEAELRGRLRGSRPRGRSATVDDSPQ